MDPFSTYLWKRPNSWTSKSGKNVQKKCSISNWDEIVAELFRDDGALLSGDGLCVRGDDDRLHLDWSSLWWWWLWGCSGKGGEEGKEDGDHVFTVFTRCRPPVPFLARTTLSLLEMYMYLGRSISIKLSINPSWPGGGHIVDPLSRSCVYLCKYAYELVKKTWLFSVMSLEKGSTLFTP